MSRKSSHDEFLELCAVATAGQLTAEEQERLREHVSICSSCADAMREYEEIAAKAIPAMADQFLSKQRTRESSDWSENRAEDRLLSLIEQEQRFPKLNPREIYPDAAPNLRHQSSIRAAACESIWRHVWLQYAAGVLLVAALGITVYRVGLDRGVETVNNQPPRLDTNSVATQSTHPTPEQRQGEKGDRNSEATIDVLRHQLAQQSAELARLKDEGSELREELRLRADGTQQLDQERINLQKELDARQANLTALQQNLDSLEQESAIVSARTKGLETQVSALNAELHERNDTVEQQQELLAHDRDIRELMGARDLYIAEVYDVAGSGTTKKPYGRVFYTKGKSLVFYAYDLDQQKGMKNAAFQAWGRREQDSSHSVNLGVFYEDSATNKRWVLRCDDPKTLAQIDAVFVTVEPDGGSQTPSARKLLFASLKIDPNHP